MTTNKASVLRPMGSYVCEMPRSKLNPAIQYNERRLEITTIFITSCCNNVEKEGESLQRRNANTFKETH